RFVRVPRVLLSFPTRRSSDLGTYVVRGKGHFIEADHPTLNRWIFVPPARRNNAAAGDLVQAHINQHPFPHGKAQADIDAVIGHRSEEHTSELQSRENLVCRLL